MAEVASYPVLQDALPLPDPLPHWALEMASWTKGGTLVLGGSKAEARDMAKLTVELVNKAVVSDKGRPHGRLGRHAVGGEQPPGASRVADLAFFTAGSFQVDWPLTIDQA